MTPQARTAFYYITQFLPAGAAHAYAGIWMAGHGLTGFEIGVVTTLPIAIIVLSNVLVGRLADRARDWRSSLQICSALFLLFTIGLFWANSFWPILICFTGANVAGALAAPIGDAAALHLTSKGRGHIGTLRGLATSGYLVALFLTGYAAQFVGPTAFIVLSIGFAALRLATAMLLPQFKTNAETAVLGARVGFRALLRPHLFWPILSWAVIYAPILALNSFLSLHLQHLGYAASTISWLVAAGAFTEVLVFLAFRHVEHVLDLRLFVLIAGLVSVIRWLAMAADPGLPLLLLMQLTHGITYGLGFVASISYVSRNSTSAEAAEAQSFFNVVQQVLAVLFITVFSTVFDSLGARSFIFSALAAALGCVIIASAYVSRRKAAAN